MYLGLVLVGATPQALAQAAMTRQFNVKDEVEVKDGLDNKPGSEEIDLFLQKNLESAVSDIIRKYRTKAGKKKRSVAGHQEFWVALSRSYYSVEKADSESSIGPVSKGDPNAWIEDAFLAIHKNFQRNNTWKFKDVPGFIKFSAGATPSERHKYFSLNTKLSESDFEVQVAFSRETPSDAALFAERIDALLRKRTLAVSDPLTKQIIDHTTAAAANDQVSIITRFPRAGLDALLAVDAK